MTRFDDGAVVVVVCGGAVVVVVCCGTVVVVVWSVVAVDDVAGLADGARVVFVVDESTPEDDGTRVVDAAGSDSR